MKGLYPRLILPQSDEYELGGLSTNTTDTGKDLTI